MRTDLRDRLADLAAHAPSGSPPSDLWDRGVRRHRGTQIGRGVVVAVLVALVGLGGWTWHGTRPVQPADTHGSPHLPDQFFQPSPWLDSFDGPPGPLVAVGSATRKSLFHTTRAIYGVTASRGRYGFLELPARADPGLVSGPGFALSPDGRRLAHWTSGTPTSRPNDAAVGGVATYDAVTGVTRFFRPSSAHGLTGDALVWADDGTLVFDVGRWVAGGNAGTSRYYVGYRWSMDDAQPEPLDTDIDLDVGLLTATNGLVLVPPYVLDPSTGRTTRLRGSSVNVAGLLSPSYSSLVVLRGDRTPSLLAVRAIQDVLTRRVVEPGKPRVVTPPRRVYQLLGWVDARHVAAVTRTPGNVFEQQVDSIDIRTGRATSLVRAPVVPTIATDLLSAPSAEGHPPPKPWDHRWLVGGVACCLLVIVLYVWGATRGRRP